MTLSSRIHDTAPTWLQNVWANDVGKIFTVLFAVYAVYLLIGFTLGYGVSGQLNSLNRLTFLIVVYGIAVLVVNLHWGYAGLFNIGVAGFMAIGVYVSVMLTRPVAGNTPTGTLPGLGLPLPIGILGGVLAAATIGYVVALPSLRLRDDYLAIVTLAFAEIARITFKSSEVSSFTVFGTTLGTGGGRGIRTYPNPITQFFEGAGAPMKAAVANLGYEPSLVPQWAFVLVLAAILAGVLWLINRLGYSPFGRALKAVRDDEEAAASLAKNTSSFKIRAFVIGCGILGLLGIFWQGSQGYVTPSLFTPELTFFVWIALIIGGVGSNTGSVIGAILFVAVIQQGPTYARLLIRSFVDVPSSAGTFPEVIHALVSGSFDPALAYFINNLSALRVVLTGAVLVWLLKNRPSGLFGDRSEVAAAIDVQDRIREKRGDES